MFSRGKIEKTTPIAIKFDEPLTSDSCSKIITELIKYILYQKQQIPFSCDTLLQLKSRIKPNDRNFNSTNNLFTTLDNITDQLTSQLHLTDCDIKEVIVIIGATTISPKFCVKFELPTLILSSKIHLEYQHSYRKPLLHLMRSLIECPEFQEAMTAPLCPTNTFVLVQKSDSNPKSEFFLPKPQYTPPIQTTTCISIKFYHNEDIPMACTCSSIVKVYNDNESNQNNDCNLSDKIDDFTKTKAPYLWYQSRAIVKGFKYSR
ncbi:hypothetical protein PV325_010764 [Microctonus aethiopoides]|uniref:MAD2L1-binding protein n=1 Tax=Microctonus aethiopoides TaxID=144406 RepID=A0AA39F719_9HYME|nr:hypothetical protein PV325_010764 [Microctonus aethiopoides]KAK0164145.1 hypothetical protein PV328_002806 [Microctonus aethiopoides]